MRIPFDSLCLAAVVAEAQPMVGSRVERTLEVDEKTVVLGTYRNGQFWLLLSVDALAPRAYLVTRRPEAQKNVGRFCSDLRRLLTDAEVEFIRQVRFDRLLEIGFAGPSGRSVLHAELTGKHANLILVGESGMVATAAIYEGQNKTARPVLASKPYAPPPLPVMRSLLSVQEGDDLRDVEGASPFLQKLVASGQPLATIQSTVTSGSYEPVYSPGNGAYPVSVGSLGLEEVPRSSVSIALEQHFAELVETDHVTRARAGLVAQLERVLLAREVALQDLAEALDAARNARRLQQNGELILAYQHQIQPGDSALRVMGYEGAEVEIPLRQDLTPLENAERLFSKAKRAKGRAEELKGQEQKLRSDAEALNAALGQARTAESMRDLEPIVELAERSRWLAKHGAATKKSERPFEGHAVRELLSPGGWRVLVGQNSTANDYLTTKFARPSDLWFHVRGGPSAHVILCTNNQPARVQNLDLEFAAQTAARNSTQKHSSYVAVDYTQKRYVRKPRGSAAGLAVYDHEKTIHVTMKGSS
ncbi:MAG: NFACT family protein [Armatimonadetes bacterium]|nr:NFACT family protein [Armatimonadota bacterium]